MRSLLVGLVFVSSVASAKTFEFIPDSPELVPVLWSYREVATRTVIGCRQWDVLQGSGWFQATWYTDYTPVLNKNIYSVTPTQKLPAKICAAEMDAYNSVRVEFNGLRGSFSVNPDGFANETTIVCRPNPAGSEYDNLACDEAHVSTRTSGVIRIHMSFQAD